jgi:uncharacterized protein YjbJ (UPF0337 family)
MNWDQIEGQWIQWSGAAMLRWEKIMNDNTANGAGNYEELGRNLQENYANAKEEARRQVAELKKIVNQLTAS